MPFRGGGVERGVAVVVACKQEIAGQLGGRDVFELPGFGRGMNRGEARLGGGDEVVVADHLMPGGNGMSFLVRAREEYPHMQRILVTGYMKPEMLLRSVNEAALFRYLLKPVSLAELMKVVIEAAKLHDQLVA